MFHQDILDHCSPNIPVFITSYYVLLLDRIYDISLMTRRKLMALCTATACITLLTLSCNITIGKTDLKWRTAVRYVREWVSLHV